MTAWTSVLVFALFFCGGSAQTCGEYFKWDESDLCYAALDGPYRYADVAGYCKDIGGQLTSFHTQDQYDNSQQFMHLNVSYFVNAVKAGDTFTWADGSTIDKKFWISGQPNVQNGSCVVFDNPQLTQKGLRAADCNKISGVLCYQRPSQICQPSDFSFHRLRNISSINYPSGKYLNDINCTSGFHAQYGTGTLIFTNMELEVGRDFVTIYDGPSTAAKLIASVNQNSQNFTVSGSGQHLTMLFTTDESVTYRGWAVDYFSGNSSAPQHLGNNGFITSPGYPNNYPPFSAQFYYFFNGTDKTYNFTFTHFDTEGPFDALYIYEGSPPQMTGEYSGNNYTMPILFSAKESNVMVVFSSDNEVQYSGFAMAYEAVPKVPAPPPQVPI